MLLAPIFYFLLTKLLLFWNSTTSTTMFVHRCLNWKQRKYIFPLIHRCLGQCRLTRESPTREKSQMAYGIEFGRKGHCFSLKFSLKFWALSNHIVRYTIITTRYSWPVRDIRGLLWKSDKFTNPLRPEVGLWINPTYIEYTLYSSDSLPS